tara:strand:- start:716 stop:2440 length:1725 start_codon:yes stop_codon:yes gene_type:complete
MNIINNIYKNINPKYLFLLVILAFLLIILSILEILSLGSIPILLSSILDQNSFDLKFLKFQYLNENSENMSQKNKIELISLIIIALFIFKNLFHASIFFFQGRLLKNIKLYISRKLFNFYLNQNYLYFVKKNTSIIQRTLSIDVGNTIIYILSLMNIAKECLILVAIIILLFFSNAEITIFLFTSFLTVASLFYFLNKKKILKRGKEIQIYSSGLIRIIYETIGLFKELKIYGLRDYQYKSYSNKIEKSERNIFLNYFITSMPRLFLEMTAVILIVIIIFMQLQKNNDIITILPFLSLMVVVALRLIPVFNSLATSLSNLKAIQPSFDLIFSELNNIPKNDNIEGNVEYLKFKKNIKLTNVSFNYDDKNNIINNLNFEINKGDKIGIIGSSGAGKSTLVNIIMGLFKHKKGKIFIDDRELFREKNQFIENISYVPQEVFLIEDRLKMNIALGVQEDKISIRKLMNVSKAAQIDNLINNLKDGFETIVEENGRNFSVGQKQRIGVARALYRDSDLIIFDESTSSLDNVTEKQFIDDIFRIFEDKTIIFISHKVSALRKCNKIFDLKTNLFVKSEI